MLHRLTLFAMATAMVPTWVSAASLPGVCPGSEARFDVGTQWHARGLAVDDKYIVTVDYTGLTVWSDADPWDLQPVTSYVLPFGEPRWFASDVVLDRKGYAFLQRAYPGYGLGPESVLILDLTVVPPRPVRSLTLPSSDAVLAIAVDDGLLVASGDRATYLYDVHRPERAALVATIQRPHAHPVLAGGLLVTVDQVGLTTYDVTEPARPVEMARLESFDGESTVRAWIFGQTLVASASRVTQVIDLADPSAPAVIASDLPRALINMVEIDGRIFAASLTNDLMEFDLSDPTSPAVVASAAAGVADGLAGRGSTLWVTDWERNFGILAYDLSAGLELASWDHPAAFAVDIAARDDLAAVALWTAGVKLFDLNDPARSLSR